MTAERLVTCAVVPTVAGRLIGIARRPARRAPMETVTQAMVAADGGVEGDHKGLKFPKRGVSVLAREDWAAALAALGPSAADGAGVDGNANALPWTLRRANLLVEGVALPRAKGAIVRIGIIVLEVTAQTYPCRRMEEAHPGLMKALAVAWRGGISCRVIEGGTIQVGDDVRVLSCPPSRAVKLPG